MISQLFTAGPFWSNPLLQSTVCIAVGLIASLLLRRRSARAHQVLFLAMIASVAVPVMSMIVRHYELGIFVDKPTVTKSKVAEIPIVPIITEYEISPLPAIPNSYYPEPIESEYMIPAAAFPSEAKAKLPLSRILIWSWIIVSTILAARLFVTFILGLRTLRRAFPLHCDKLNKALLIAKGKLGIEKPVEVLAGSSVSSPVIWCWSKRPLLLIPADAHQFEGGVDWVGMFCHELAHWSRLDHISGLFAELIVCVFPWHPLMWWAKRQLAGLSEQACDDWVVASSRSPADYAESLLDLTPQGQLSFLPAVVGRKNGLENRVRRIIKDKCGKPNLGFCWAVVVTLIAACITIGAAFAQTRPADIDEVKDECEKLVAEEYENELAAQEKLLAEAELLAEQTQLEKISEQLKLKQLEQQQLDQLGSQLKLEKLKQKEIESTVQLRLEQLKHLNALAHQQAEYQKQAKIIESEIQLLRQATAKAKQHHDEGLSDFAIDKNENETRELQLQELVNELRALRAKITNMESLLQATISELYGQTKQNNQFVQTTRTDPLQQTAERDELALQQSILQIEADNLQQELDFLEGLRQEKLEKAKTHEQMRTTLEAIDKHRYRIRSNVPSTLIGGELFQDDELTVLNKIRSDLQILADKTRLKLEECRDKKEADKLRGVLDNIDTFIKYIDGRIPDYLRSREQAKRSELSFCIERQKLIDHRSELEERKSQLKRHLEIAPERKDAKEIRLELEQIEVEILDINDQLIAMSQQQRLKSSDEYEAKRKELLPKRRALEERAKYIQWRLKEAPDREDAVRLRAELDEIDKQIREIDFELSSPEWCAQKRKAEQNAMQKYKSEMERAKANFNKMTKREDSTISEFDYWVEQRKAKAPIKEDQWLTTPPQLPQERHFHRQQQEFQTTTPPSKQGQAHSPWQPEEKLQSRIKQLQDEISRLRSEMAEMRKLMKDMVEYEKNRPKPSLYNIDKDPMDFEKNQRKKPLPEMHSYPLEPGKKQPKKALPEIHGDSLAPEKIELEPSENKPQQHPPDDIPIELEEIETPEPKTPSH